MSARTAAKAALHPENASGNLGEETPLTQAVSKNKPFGHGSKRLKQPSKTSLLVN